MAVMCYNAATAIRCLGSRERATMTGKNPSLKFTAACFTGPKLLRNQYSFEYLYPEEIGVCISDRHLGNLIFYKHKNIKKDSIDKWVINSKTSFKHIADKVDEIYTNRDSGISFLLMYTAAKTGGSFIIRPDYKDYDSVMLAVGTLRRSREYGYDTFVCNDVGVIVGGVDKVGDNNLQADTYRFPVITGSVDQVNSVCKFLESTGATQIARFMVGPLVILPSGTDDDTIRQEKDKMERVMRWVSGGPCSWLGANLFWHDYDCGCFNCSESTESGATFV